MIEKECEEEEVLQTKIISPKEVLAEWPKWIAPSKDEIGSLITEKLALKPVPKEEVKRLVQEAEKLGR